MYLHIVKVLEDNYPEMLKRMFIVNGNSVNKTNYISNFQIYSY